MRLLCLTLLLLGGTLGSAQDAQPGAQPGATVVSGPEAAAAVDSLTQSDTKSDATNATTAPAKLQLPTQDQVSKAKNQSCRWAIFDQKSTKKGHRAYMYKSRRS